MASSPRPAVTDTDWPFAVSHPIEVRFRDTDAMGHVNNAVFLTYTEIARQAYWRRMSGIADYQRVPFILAHARLDFRSPALVDEEIEIGIRVEWIGTRSFAFGYRVRDRRQHRLIAEAFTVQAVYDYEAQRTYPFPESLRKQIEAFEGRSIPPKP